MVATKKAIPQVWPVYCCQVFEEYNKRKVAYFSKGDHSVYSQDGWVSVEKPFGVLLIGDDESSAPIVYLRKHQVNMDRI